MYLYSLETLIEKEHCKFLLLATGGLKTYCPLMATFLCLLKQNIPLGCKDGQATFRDFGYFLQ